MPGFALEESAHLTGAGDTDSVMRMVLELASEMWVLRDRLTLLEYALAEQNIDLETLDEPVTDPGIAAALAEQRRLLTDRLVAAASGNGNGRGEANESGASRS